MSDQWTHIHIFLRARMMGGTLFERCVCGRARSPVMTDHESFRAQVAADAVRSAAMVRHFRDIYGAHVFGILPGPTSLMRLLNG